MATTSNDGLHSTTDDDAPRRVALDLLKDSWFTNFKFNNKTIQEYLFDSDLANTDLMQLLHLRPASGVRPLNTFVDMWWGILFWVIISSIIVHCIAAIVCAICLNKYKYNVYITLTIVVHGFVFPLTLGAATSAALAWASYHTTLILPSFYAFVFGVGQTVVYVFVSFTKILATL